MKKEDKNILEKYLNGKATVDEQARIEKLLSTKDGAAHIKDYLKSDWYEYLKSDEIVEKDISSILDKIHHSIHLNENKSKQTIIRRIYRWSSAAAAILLIPLLIASAFLFSELGKVNSALAEIPSSVNITSPFGAKLTFQLPDGSKGVLNSGSSIEYSVPFTNNRNIKLAGEAYFDVEHSENYPFIVTANQLELKVLGTWFNVYAYPEVNKTEVILEEGKVECLIGARRKKIIMNVDERIVLLNGKITRSKVNAKKFTAWKNGQLVFRGDSMEEVARRLARWYSIEVEIANDEIRSYSFRGTFDNDPLEEVLRLLKMTSPINYKIIKRKKLSDDTYSKKKVIFYK